VTTTIRSGVNIAAAAAAELSTAVLSDALDRLGIVGQVPSLSRHSGKGVMAGPAFTVRYEPVGNDGGTVGDFADDVEPGSVIILANAGRMEMTVWGGLLSQVAFKRGIAGTVVDGCCRDIDDARLAGYPLFSAGIWMRTGKDRVRAEAMQVPVSIGGIRVRPDDLVVGDCDGVLVIPVERIDEVLSVAEGIEGAERQIAEGVRVGRLDDVRRSVGYFELQRRDLDESVGDG
jgi:4-hydroxy-4-methyl-2-oxoglutarate aldolase